MATGDVFKKYDATLGASDMFDMAADANTECVIHNITVNTSSQASTTALEYYDGSQAYVVDTITGNGAWMGMFLHCTPTQYYRLNPTDATNTLACCDGVVTKAV